jgi:transcriptional antiterminator Rof (Rho-off)
LYYVDSKFNFIGLSLFFFREKTKLREGIVARRQKKLIMRRARQKYLEEAALREAELLQELDRFNSLAMAYLVFLHAVVL